jgi:hypothetical protein
MCRVSRSSESLQRLIQLISTVSERVGLHLPQAPPEERATLKNNELSGTQEMFFVAPQAITRRDERVLSIKTLRLPVDNLRWSRDPAIGVFECSNGFVQGFDIKRLFHPTAHLSPLARTQAPIS